MYRSGVASKAELDNALAARDTAAALVEAAKQASAMTDIGPRSEEIRGAQAQLQQMKAALDYANTQLAATEIKSPIAGTVLERIVERGEMVSPSAFVGSGARTSVVDLADLTDLQIELDISQSDFSRLKMSTCGDHSRRVSKPALSRLHCGNCAGGKSGEVNGSNQSEG